MARTLKKSELPKPLASLCEAETRARASLQPTVWIMIRKATPRATLGSCPWPRAPHSELRCEVNLHLPWWNMSRSLSEDESHLGPTDFAKQLILLNLCANYTYLSSRRGCLVTCTKPVQYSLRS